MNYNPGTHLIVTLFTPYTERIQRYEGFQELADRLILQHELQKLGEVYHHFSPHGFTGVICLSESHLSVHTWPEHGKINLDIYLSNHLRSNDGTVTKLYTAIRAYFEATVLFEQTIKR